MRSATKSPACRPRVPGATPPGAARSAAGGPANMSPEPNNEAARAPPSEGPSPSTGNDAPDLFAPSIRRVLFVLILAIGAFFIPQEIALEWYPLNNPGNDIHYLEATLRTSNTGTIRILYDCG